jgi:hypothetical protein
MGRLRYRTMMAAVALALAHITNARAQLMIETRCDATQSHCVMLIGPPGDAKTVFIPLIGGTQARQLRCTQVEDDQVWPARPPMRQCRLWE